MQKTHLDETALLSTNNIGLYGQIRILEDAKRPLPRALLLQLYYADQFDHLVGFSWLSHTSIHYTASMFSRLMHNKQFLHLPQCFSTLFNNKTFDLQRYPIFLHQCMIIFDVICCRFVVCGKGLKDYLLIISASCKNGGVSITYPF